MYSPGWLKLAVVTARPSTSFDLDSPNTTAPGPRYIAQMAVMPTAFPARTGSPSSVADTVRVKEPGPVIVRSAGSMLTWGGVLELIFSLFPPRVVRRRSIIQTGFSVPAT